MANGTVTFQFAPAGRGTGYTNASRRLLVTTSDASLFRVLLTIPGAVVKTNHSATFAPDPTLVDRIRTLAEARGAQVSADAAVRAWYVEAETRARDLLTIQAASDTDDDDTPRGAWVPRLRPYQRVGAAWLARVGRGLLGDEMGLGKTVEALTAARAQGARTTLVICPNIAKRAVWERQIAYWLAEERPSIVVAEGPQRDRRDAVLRFAHPDRDADPLASASPQFLIVNHEMLRYNALSNVYAPLWETHWDCVIVDEAHKFQGRRSEQSIGAARLRTDALYLLTGTPVWNRPESLWHLLHLIDPARWPSFWNWVDLFYDTYLNPARPQVREILGVKESMRETLQQSLAPVLLRRTATDPTVALSLPPLVVQDIPYILTPQQRTLYTALKKQFVLLDPAVGVGARAPDDILDVETSTQKAFTDLRRLCNAPQLVHDVYVDLPSAKDAVLTDLTAQAIREEKGVVVFVWHRDEARHVARVLHEFAPLVLTGATSARDRTNILDAFGSGASQVLVASLAVAGYAIDLTAASVAIFAETDWLPATYDQALKRLHRPGQRRHVHVYRVYARDTVEQAIWETVDDKSATTSRLLAWSAVVARTLAHG